MILHYAHLCDAAGGVDAFLIGSEMRGITQVRSGAATYPAVQALRDLAADCRAILGADAITPEEVADAVIAGMADERFLILPHPQVGDFYAARATDTDR